MSDTDTVLLSDIYPYISEFQDEITDYYQQNVEAFFDQECPLEIKSVDIKIDIHKGFGGYGMSHVKAIKLRFQTGDNSSFSSEMTWKDFRSQVFSHECKFKSFVETKLQEFYEKTYLTILSIKMDEEEKFKIEVYF